MPGLGTKLPPIGRAGFPAADGAHLTPFGWKLARLIFRFRRCLPFVTMRRYLIVKAERDRLLHDLHMAAIQQNRREDEIRAFYRDIIRDLQT